MRLQFAYCFEHGQKRIFGKPGILIRHFLYTNTDPHTHFKHIHKHTHGHRAASSACKCWPSCDVMRTQVLHIHIYTYSKTTRDSRKSAHSLTYAIVCFGATERARLSRVSHHSKGWNVIREREGEIVEWRGDVLVWNCWQMTRLGFAVWCVIFV